MYINTTAECRDALRRIEALSGAAKGSDEEAEAIGLIDAVNAFRFCDRTPANDDLARAIRSTEDYERVSVRIAELSDFPEGTPQADELAFLIADVREWDDRKTRD